MTNQKNPQSADTPEKQLLVLRIIWGALLFGECLFLTVALLVIIPKQPKPNQPQAILQWLSLGMAATIIPAVFMFRLLLLNKAREIGAVNTQTTSSANIIFWAGCEGVAFFGIVAAIINASAWPTFICPAAAILCQLGTFPKAEA